MNETIITTSWDDGSPLDLKLAKLLKKYDIPATFYIPINNIERKCMNSFQIRQIGNDFDVGGHTIHHYDLTKVPIDVAEREIVDCKDKLEAIVGKEATLFCYPKGSYNKGIIGNVKKAGFSGARTMSLFETAVKNPFQMGTTVQFANNPKHYYAKEFVKARNLGLFCFIAKNLPNKLFLDWYQLALITLDYVKTTSGIWHLWGHSWEIEENNDWWRLEKLFEKMKNIAETEKNISLVDNSHLISRAHE